MPEPFNIRRRDAREREINDMVAYVQRDRKYQQVATWEQSRTKLDETATSRRNFKLSQEELKNFKHEELEARKQRIRQLWDHETQLYEQEINKRGLAFVRARD